MAKRSTVHLSKIKAIIQLGNFLCPSSIVKIFDLADGEILQKTIQAKFPDFSEDFENAASGYLDTLNSAEEDKIKLKDGSCDKLDFVEEDTSIAEDDRNIRKSTRKSTLEIKKEGAFVKNENQEKDSVISIKPIESHPAKNEAILKRFNYVQKFIDHHYKIKSEDIISYAKVYTSELELTKVSLFVFSEIIKQLVAVGNEAVQTLYHLDPKLQIELEDILKLFISERSRLSKYEVENLLFRSAMNGSTENLFATPRRTSLRQSDQKCISPPTPKEEAANSPLKKLLESPNLLTEIFRKNMELECLKKTVEDEDAQSIKLQEKLSEIQDELKKKDNDYKQLQKQMAKMKEEIEFLQDSCQSESCKQEKEGLVIENNKLKINVQYYLDEFFSLNSRLTKSESDLMEKDHLKDLAEMKKKKSLSSSDEKEVLMNAAKQIKVLEEEIEVLTNDKNSLELKNHAYKKQLANLLLKTIRERESPENLNKSYEEEWSKLAEEREEENLGFFIEEDNKNLWTRLNEANLKNKKLLDEIKRLKMQITKDSKKSEPKVCSVATMTMLEEVDTSIELPRNLLNSSYVLNNQDNHISFDHSQVMPSPGKSCDAVLWKMYESEKLEAENMYDINLNHDSAILETSPMDFINDLGVNEKIDNAEAEIALGKENKYVLGNLNFNIFLNELKKLTKNGSFQKVLQAFGKCQKEIYGKNRSNRLDLQDLLKMITECVCVAVASNAEYSSANLQDKSCSTDEDFCDVNKDTNLPQLKGKLNVISKEYEIKLQECKEQLEKLKKDKQLLELKCQASNQMFLDKKEVFEELLEKYNETKLNYDLNAKKYSDLSANYQNLLESRWKQDKEYLQLKKRAQSIYRKKRDYENTILKLKAQNDQLKKHIQEMKEKIQVQKKISKENAMEERGRKMYKSDFQFPSRDSCFGVPHPLNVKSEFHSTLQDTANESVLSGAFHKSLSHYVENEEDFFNYNSLDIMKNDYKEDRVEELKRRNTCLPFLLQSSYPIESDLHTSYESLYVKDGEKCKEEPISKKLKLDEAVLKELATPVKPKKLETPKSLQKLMRNLRYKGAFYKKPK